MTGCKATSVDISNRPSDEDFVRGDRMQSLRTGTSSSAKLECHASAIRPSLSGTSHPLVWTRFGAIVSATLPSWPHSLSISSSCSMDLFSFLEQPWTTLCNFVQYEASAQSLHAHTRSTICSTTAGMCITGTSKNVRPRAIGEAVVQANTTVPSNFGCHCRSTCEIGQAREVLCPEIPAQSTALDHI